MTDNEIIKALECCGAGICKEECFGYFMTGTNECTTELTKNALALINRQKAEIEGLKYNLGLRQKNKKTVRADAVKEFAERLKGNTIDIDVSFGYGREHYTEAVTVVEIDNLVKEFTEGEGK